MRAGDFPGTEGHGAEAQGRSPPPNTSRRGLAPAPLEASRILPGADSGEHTPSLLTPGRRPARTPQGGAAVPVRIFATEAWQSGR